MPPKGEPLTADQIALLKAWIDRGAKWPDTGSEQSGKLDHWAFRPVVRPAVPVMPEARNPIDAFIRARLAREHLPAAPEADRRTLIRRLKFDLIGLPPTPEEVDAFVADDATRRRTRSSSIGIWRRRTTASAGRATGSTWSALPRATASRRTSRARTPGRIAITSSAPSMTTSRTTASSCEQLAGDLLGADAATGFLVAGAVRPGRRAPTSALTLAAAGRRTARHGRHHRQRRFSA